MKLELGTNRMLDGPDTETIARCLAELDWKEEVFAKLSRDEFNYLQTTGNHPEGFIVEYQDGSEEQFSPAQRQVPVVRQKPNSYQSLSVSAPRLS
jgi:hypothetical protein